LKAKSKVENIFCRIDFKQSLDIDEKRAKREGLEEGKNLPAYIYTHPSYNIKMMIFSSGEVFLNGAKSFEQIESAFWDLKKKLKRMGNRINLSEDTEIEVENVLATGNIRDYFPTLTIDLERISEKDNASYDPEKYPAVFLTYALAKTKGTAMVFPSGKVLIGDVKSQEDANLILEKVIETVRSP
jgi:TATA-box binding protein (TBP) (component of TFIID and TFIIIB)